MPYVDKPTRRGLDDGRVPVTPGELNYAITKLCLAYMEWPNIRLNYTLLNDVIGALECARLEFYRKMVVPYENQKADENGDVYA